VFVIIYRSVVYKKQDNRYSVYIGFIPTINLTRRMGFESSSSVASFRDSRIALRSRSSSTNSAFDKGSRRGYVHPRFIAGCQSAMRICISPLYLSTIDSNFCLAIATHSHPSTAPSSPVLLFLKKYGTSHPASLNFSMPSLDLRLSTNSSHIASFAPRTIPRVRCK